MSKGKAAKSESGASMSKYDVEVEARLQALESAVSELQSHSHGASDGDLNAKVDSLIDSLRNFKQIKGLLQHF